MPIDMNYIRGQLIPAWTGVNIALVVGLFLLAWPLSLLMIAYIHWGSGLGLDLSRPETFSRVFERLVAAVRAGRTEFGSRSSHDNPGSDSPPDDPAGFARWRNDEINKLEARRRALDEEGLRRPAADR